MQSPLDFMRLLKHEFQAQDLAIYSPGKRPANKQDGETVMVVGPDEEKRGYLKVITKDNEQKILTVSVRPHDLWPIFDEC
jgi:hypothetical protein